MHLVLSDLDHVSGVLYLLLYLYSFPLEYALVSMPVPWQMEPFALERIANSGHLLPEMCPLFENQYVDHFVQFIALEIFEFHIDIFEVTEHFAPARSE